MATMRSKAAARALALDSFVRSRTSDCSVGTKDICSGSDASRAFGDTFVWSHTDCTARESRVDQSPHAHTHVSAGKGFYLNKVMQAPQAAGLGRR